jgi:IMP dehydrogenase/GMP reductase
MRVGLTFDDVLLVPKRSPLGSRKDADVSSRITRTLGINTPILSANMPWCTEHDMALAMAACGGLGLIHRMTTVERQVTLVEKVKSGTADSRFFEPSRDPSGRPLVGAAVGVTDDYFDRAHSLIDAGADVLVVDVAHGHADHTLDAVERLKAAFPANGIIAGNVATAAGTRDLIDAGADAVKAGIGPGSMCTTRIVTGAGVPQLSAITECAAEADKDDVPVIADGGIRTPGDIAKALAAGASTVMLGGMLAGADESAAMPITVNGRQMRTTTGYPSVGMKITLKTLRGEAVSEDELRAYVPEGTEATYLSTGPVLDTILRCVGGLQSGMSYSGATTLAELRANAEFIEVRSGGFAEGLPHALTAAQVDLDRSRFLGGSGSRLNRDGDAEPQHGSSVHVVQSSPAMLGEDVSH